MNLKTLLGGLASLAAVAALVAAPPVARAQIPGSGRAESLAKAEKEKKAEDQKKNASKPKPEDWKMSAPDTTGLTFKGQKTLQLRLSTDAKGKIATADIDKSSGDPALDKRVAEWAQKHWSGPPSAKTKVPVTVGQ